MELLEGLLHGTFGSVTFLKIMRLTDVRGTFFWTPEGTEIS